MDFIIIIVMIALLLSNIVLVYRVSIVLERLEDNMTDFDISYLKLTQVMQYIKDCFNK